MRVLSLEVENIISIEKASLTFEDNGLILVEGWNYDTQRANGAGKTAIFNCLAFGLYDQLPRKITASEILRRGTKSGFVRVSVLCGEDTWTVQRSRPKGVLFFKNGTPQDISQSEFESFIRLTYEQFLLTIYTPQANSRKFDRFLRSADADKKEFLLQLLNLNQFGNIKKSIDDKIKMIQASIDVETTKLSSTRSRIEAYEESLVDTTLLQESITDDKLSIFTLEKQILELSNVAKPDLSKYIKVEDDIRNKQAEIAQAKAKRQMLQDRYRELGSTIADYDSDQACGECGASVDTPAARTAHAEHQSKAKQKMIDVKKQIDDADLICSKEQSIKDVASKLRDKKQQDNSDYQTAQLQITDLKALVRTKTSEVNSATLKISSNSELINKIEVLKVAAEKYIVDIASYKKDLELYKTLSAVYSPTGAQAYVLDSIVDSFNEVIQKYIDIMSPNMVYTLNSFKETAKGDITAKFSETFTIGGEAVSVGSLSGGEEKGLSLCVDFALMEVLETQFGMTLNPIILDEPFDGLDAAGREIVIDLLENLARNRQIFVVDHASEAKALFTKSMRVELRNKISTISVEA